MIVIEISLSDLNPNTSFTASIKAYKKIEIVRKHFNPHSSSFFNNLLPVIVFVYLIYLHKYFPFKSIIFRIYLNFYKLRSFRLGTSKFQFLLNKMESLYKVKESQNVYISCMLYTHIQDSTLNLK